MWSLYVSGSESNNNNNSYINAGRQVKQLLNKSSMNCIFCCCSFRFCFVVYVVISLSDFVVASIRLEWISN